MELSKKIYRKSRKIRASIIVAVFNMDSTIKECIDSLLNENLKDCEIIVINDNSTDKTKRIISKYKNIKIINEKIRRGIASTRNVGIKKGKGNIIIFVDADCIVQKNSINKLIEFLEKNEQVVGVSGIAYSYDRNSIIGLSHEARLFEYSILDNKAREIKFIATMFSGFRRDVLLKINGFDEELTMACEDADLSFRCRRYGKLFIIPDAKVFHHHPTKIFPLWKKWFSYGIGWAQFSKKNHYYKDMIATFMWMASFFLFFILAIVFKNLIFFFAGVSLFLAPWLILYFPNTLRYLLRYKKPQALLFIIPHNIQILARSAGVLMGIFK